MARATPNQTKGQRPDGFGRERAVADAPGGGIPDPGSLLPRGPGYGLLAATKFEGHLSWLSF
jgi:hypothetical protein